MKTKEQVDEFTNWAPVGMIVQVPKDFKSESFLDLDGTFVSKRDYPRLAEAIAKTMFDVGDQIKLVDASELQLDASVGAVGVKINYTDTNIKLVIKAK